MSKRLETYESEDLLQCLECGDIYDGESCPNCGSTIAKRYNEDDKAIQELEF